MKIAVLGRTHWLLNSAKAVASAGHVVALVATAPSQPEYQVHAEDFERFAAACGARYLFDPDANSQDFANEVEKSGARIAISVNWPKILRLSATSSLPLGILNGHAGDLPRYRGNACPNWAILNDEAHVGLCVHAVDPGELDSGAVFARRRLNIGDDTYIADIYRWIESQLPSMFVEAVERAQTPGFAPELQMTTGLKPLRCHPRRPADGLIDWSASAVSIARLVRASSRPFAGAFTYLEGVNRATIWRARPSEVSGEICAVAGQIIGRGPRKGVLVACGSGVLEIEEAELKNGQTLPVANRYRFQNPSQTV